MKKPIAILMILMLMLSLCACGGKEQPAEGSAPASDSIQSGGNTQAGESLSVSGEGWEEVDPDAPFGEYRSEEELLKLLNSGAAINYASIDPSVPSEPLSVDEETEYTPKVNAVTFEEGGVPGGVELWDWQSEMSEEELAAFEEMESFDPNDPEYQAMMEELEQDMAELEQYEDMEDYQQQIEDAQKELENLDLPEGYEQYLPEGFNLEDYMP